MKEGWLWLSILNTTACPSPISMTPAFSPGPWITHGASVGRVRRCRREDLYEQCSFHMAETMPSSVRVGSRPMRSTKRRYSSSFSPCSRTRSGVIGTSFWIIMVLARWRWASAIAAASTRGKWVSDCLTARRSRHGFRRGDGTTVTRFAVTQNLEKIVVDVDARIPLAFARLLRIDHLDVNARAEVPLDKVTLEVALVL